MSILLYGLGVWVIGTLVVIFINGLITPDNTDVVVEAVLWPVVVVAAFIYFPFWAAYSMGRILGGHNKGSDAP